MNKAFVKEQDGDEDDEAAALALAIPAGSKNYIRPEGYQRIKDELLQLIDVERPEVVKIVHWAASNGDRSENGDYIYGKRRLREIDRRIRFLTKRLDSAALSTRARTTAATRCSSAPPSPTATSMARSAPSPSSASTSLIR
jgi:transcription elongation factor GreB